MNIKNKIFLGLALVSTAGFMQAMERNDIEILKQIEKVEYSRVTTPDGIVMDIWKGKLPGAKHLTIAEILNGPNSGNIGIKGSLWENNFTTLQGVQTALNYLRQKYTMQESGTTLAQ